MEDDEVDDDVRRRLLSEGVMTELAMEELRKIVKEGLPGGLEAMRQSVRRYRRR